MTRREKLIENYENALSALRMDEEPLADSRYADPEDRRRGRSVHVLRRAATAVVLAAAMLSAAFVWSERVRVAALNAINDARALFSELRARDDSTPVQDAVVIDGLEYHYNVALEGLPEGYNITYGIELLNGTATLLYENETGGWIELYTSSYGATIQVDTENAQIEEITIQNCSGWFIRKEIDYLPDSVPYTECRVIWLDDEQQIVTDVIVNDLSKEELIRLAEGVHWGGAK